MLPELNNTEIAFKYRSDKELKRAHFIFNSIKYPLVTKVGTALTGISLKWHLPVQGFIKRTLFVQFCGGETMTEAGVTANLLGKHQVNTILDYGVEGKQDEKEYDHAVPEFIKAITFAAGNSNIPFISMKVTGFARFGLLEKKNSGAQLTSEESAEFERIVARVDRICAAAAQKNVMVLIDAEESWIQQPVDDLTDSMMEKYNKDKAVVFNTFQLYRNDRLDFLKRSHAKALAKGYFLGAKLVRGAYMEKERQRAAEKGYPSPIHADKAATDADYDAAASFCLERLYNTYLFVGTHNEESCLKVAAFMQEHGLPAHTPKVYFSQLFGMSDNISFNMAHAGYLVAKYLPYGPVKDVIPYLMRRAQENTSVAGQTSRELSFIEKELKRRGI